MTKLYVTPIDPAAPGSFKARDKLLEVYAIFAQIDGEAVDPHQRDIRVFNAYRSVRDMILARLRSDDDTPVEELVDQLSYAQFEEMLQGLLGGGIVPPARSASSSSGTEESDALPAG